MKNKSIQKVAILYSGGRYFGGIEQYLLDLFENVNQDEIKLELLSLGKWELTNRLVEKGYQVKFFSQKRVYPKTIKLIGRYLKKHQFDLLVSQGTVSNAYARSVSLIYRIKNLVTVHSGQGGDYSNLAIRKSYGLIDRLTRFPTAKYIAVSNYLKDCMVKSGISASKISVIYNGIKLRPAKPSSHRTKVIGSVGRLHPVKGYDLLIQAFAQLADKGYILKIAGEGYELNKLKSLAKDLGVAKRVEFVGFKKDIYDFLDSVDIYVQSSVSEGFGLAVIEAMSQGLPVVVTPVGNLAEIVIDGKTGLVCSDLWPESIAREISKLVEDSKLAEKIGKNAKDFVIENFSVEHWVSKTVEAYKDAIK